MQKEPRIGTRAVWAGEEDTFMQGATQVPVVHSVSFGYHDVDEWLQVALGQKPGHIYSRNTNPTVQVFEEKVRSLEGADAATSAATGMGIISSTLFTLLSPGRAGRLGQGYLRRHQRHLHRVPAPLRHRGDPVRHRRPRADRSARWRSGCDVLYLESPTNPTTKVVDIARLAAAAHAVGATGDRGQHLRHPHQPEPAGTGRRPGAAQRHQVPGRARRRPGRRGLRPAGADRANLPLPRDQRRHACTRWRPTCCCAA